MNDIMDQISNELDRLHRSHWMPVIELLEQRFDGYPLEQDADRPAHAVLNILRSLETDTYSEIRFVNRVSQLDCFSYRSYYKTAADTDEYWNPLDESYREFRDRHNAVTNEYQTAVENPPGDIIGRWLKNQLQQTAIR